MELAFSATTWAWAFVGLVLPIVIHFFASRWRRPQRFAALRFLVPAAEQGRARQLNDGLLLLLRLLLLAAIVVALMAPLLSRSVERQRKITVIHPTLPLSALSLTAPSYRLCPQAMLMAPEQPCEREDETFLDDLSQLVEREADLAEITVIVPNRVAVSALSLSNLPVRLHWQVIEGSAQSDQAAAKTYLVYAPAEFAELFTALNDSGGVVRWQWTDSASLTADVAIGQPDSSAPVLWHDAALPWSTAEHNGQTLSFYVNAKQLHLKIPDRDELRQQPLLLATLAERSLAWLQRGHLQWQQQASKLNVVAEPQASGKQKQNLTDGFWLIAVLLLAIERAVFAFSQRRARTGESHART